MVRFTSSHQVLTIVGLAAIVWLILGIVVLFAGSHGPSASTYQACVDQNGNMRVLGEGLKGNYATQCKSNETLYEFAPSHRVGALETQVAELELLFNAEPTATPTWTPTATPTPTPTPTPDLLAAYQPVLAVLGANGVVLPLADFGNGGWNSATFTTIGSQSLVFTWSKAPANFDTPPALQGAIPVVAVNGVNEFSTSPDNDFWSRGDGVTDQPFSLGILINVSQKKFMAIFAKNGVGGSEWQFYTQSNGLYPGLIVRDHSAGAWVGRGYNGVIPGVNEWSFWVVTYNGSRSASGVKVYYNGAQIDNMNLVNGTYTAMENGTAPVTAPSQAFGGQIAGGACGPVFTHKELSASEVTELYNYCRGLMALP
ncbi:MAG: hypothetical protein HY532_04340 [Chloroflexi bacterium]|nr:hypothetical protein [Chloroflexota bacterium]